MEVYRRKLETWGPEETQGGARGTQGPPHSSVPRSMNTKHFRSGLRSRSKECPLSVPTNRLVVNEEQKLVGTLPGALLFGISGHTFGV